MRLLLYLLTLVLLLYFALTISYILSDFLNEHAEPEGLEKVALLVPITLILSGGVIILAWFSMRLIDKYTD